MRFLPFLFVATGLSIFTTIGAAQMAVAPIADEVASSGKCPQGYTAHKDDRGEMWCMDSQRRSYTPENAEYAATHSVPAEGHHKSFWHALMFWHKS